MSRGVENIAHAFVSGNLANDAELKYTNSGLAICNFTVVANTNKKRGEEWESYANFFDCTMFGRGAEALHKYLVKGKMVMIDGRLEQQRWENEGGKRSKVVVLVDRINLGGGGQDSRPEAPSAGDVAPWEKPPAAAVEDFKDDIF